MGLSFLLGCCLTPALADGVEIDIDDMDAEIWYSAEQWHIGIKYKIDIDEPPPGAGYVFEMSFTQGGRPVVDKDGKQIAIAIPLDRPSKRDDDEYEYSDVATIDLLRDYIRLPDKVEMVGVVLEKKSGATMTTKDAKVKLLKRPPRDD